VLPRVETGYDAHCWAKVIGFVVEEICSNIATTLHSMDTLSFGRSSSSSLALAAAISSISGSRGAVLTRFLRDVLLFLQPAASWSGDCETLRCEGCNMLCSLTIGVGLSSPGLKTVIEDESGVCELKRMSLKDMLVMEK